MTKIILTGATGFVGGQVLKAALADPRIASIIVLSRRPLSITNPKLRAIIHEDFSAYPPELLSQLRGATAVIWCIGGMVRDFGGEVEVARKVQVSYAVEAAKAMSTSAEDGGAGVTRLVVCSGAFAERDQQKQLRWLEDTRKIKGEAESGLLRIAAQSDKNFEVFCMRLGGVMPASLLGNIAGSLLGWVGLVKVEQVAKTFVDVALNGAREETFENADVVRYKFEN